MIYGKKSQIDKLLILRISSMSDKVHNDLIKGYEKFLNNFFKPKVDSDFYHKVNFINFSMDDEGNHHYYFDLDVTEQDFDKISKDTGDARKGVWNYWNTDVADFDYNYVTGVELPKYYELFGFKRPKNVYSQININNGGRNYMFYDN